MKLKSLTLVVSFFVFTLKISAQRDGWYQYTNPGIVYDMVKDSANHIHLATGTGYVLLDEDLEVLEHVTLFNNNALNTNEIKALALNPNNNTIWLCTGENEILEKSGTSLTSIDYSPDTQFEEISKIWITQNNEIIVKGGWFDTGLHVRIGNNWEELAIDNVNDFIELSNGLWLFATAYDGLKTYNKDTQQWGTLPNSPTNTSAWISDLLLDSISGSIFIATNSNGIYEYRTDSTSQNFYNFNYSNISQIYKQEDTLHVTHTGSGYSTCVLTNNTWTNYNPNNSSLPNSWLYGAFPINDGVLLRPSGAVFKYKPSIDSTTNLTLNKNGVDFYNFKKFKVRKVEDEVQFFGTTYQNQLAVKLGNNNFEIFTPENSILTSDLFNDVDLDTSGNVWVSTSDGLLKIDTANQWTRYDSTNSNGFLTSNNVAEFAVGKSLDGKPLFAANFGDQNTLSVAKDLFGLNPIITSIDSNDIPEAKKQITAFDFQNNNLIIGFENGKIISTVFPTNVLPFSVGSSFQAITDSSKVDEINNLVFSVGIQPRYHYSQFLSIHAQVGIVFSILEEDNGSFSDANPLDSAIQNYQQITSGSVGFTFWFRSSNLNSSYLLGYNQNSETPLRYIDLNDTTSEGGLPITGLNLKPTIYSIFAMPFNEDSIAIYLNTSMGLLVNKTYTLDAIANQVTAPKDLPILTAYPNPANQFITIDKLEKNSQIQILDITGKVVKTSYVNTIDVSELTCGIYLIQVNGYQSLPFIKR